MHVPFRVVPFKILLFASLKKKKSKTRISCTTFGKSICLQTTKPISLPADNLSHRLSSTQSVSVSMLILAVLD